MPAQLSCGAGQAQSIPRELIPKLSGFPGWDAQCWAVLRVTAHHYCTLSSTLPLLLQYFPPSTSRVVPPPLSQLYLCPDQQTLLGPPASIPFLHVPRTLLPFLSPLSCRGPSLGTAWAVCPGGRRLHRVMAHILPCALPWQLELCQPLPASCSPSLGTNTCPFTGLETSLGLS